MDVAQADAFYAQLLDAHAELDEARSQALNARLVLLLAARLADPEAVREAIAEARRSVDADGKV